MADHDLTISLPDQSLPRGEVELVFDEQHFERVVKQGMLRATSSVAIATADLKAMLVPTGPRRADSILSHLARKAAEQVEVRILHAGVPSAPALQELKGVRPANMIIRRCPRLHAKAIILDASAMYLGSANLTGAGLGAKGPTRRNIEWGVWTEDESLIEAVLGQFNRLWEGERCEDCGRHDICPTPLEEPDL